MRRILINASNLHHGGGVQVAASFIAELPKMLDDLPTGRLSVYVSSAVDDALAAQGFDTHLIPGYEIFNVFGIKTLAPKITGKFLGYDLVFTVFGPLYLSRRIRNHIVGFAQLWILCPDNEISRSAGLYDRFRTSFAYKIKWFFFKRLSSKLVVELPHVKNKLIAFKGYPAEKIDVAFNCVSALYFEKSAWAPMSIPSGGIDACIKIGYPARGYPHKNLQVLYATALELRQLTDVVFEFYVTLRSDEWFQFSEEYRSVIKNVGEISPAQCPTFYREMDGVLFVSLLECFSATPLEAMAMRRPIFGSDREFVHDCCGAHAIYVDPLDPKCIAAAIHKWFFLTSDAVKASRIEEAYEYLVALPDSRLRAATYIRVMNNQLIDEAI